VLVGDGEQPRAQAGIADASAGIDARADQVTQMIRIERTIDAGRQRQRGNAAIFAAPRHFEAADDEGAVETFERHHVADGGERHQIEHGHQVGQCRRAAGAQRAVDRHQHHEGDAGGAKVTQA